MVDAWLMRRVWTLQARREGADSLSPILAEQRESRAHGSVTTGSALGGAFARLAAQRAGIRRPAAISLSLPAQVSTLQQYQHCAFFLLAHRSRHCMQ